MMGPNRTVTTARMVLFMEAAHDPALRERLARGRAAMEATLLPALARLGAPDPQSPPTCWRPASKDCSSTTSAGTPQVDARPVLELVVRAALVG